MNQKEVNKIVNRGYPKSEKELLIEFWEGQSMLHKSEGHTASADRCQDYADEQRTGVRKPFVM